MALAFTGLGGNAAVNTPTVALVSYFIGTSLPTMQQQHRA
jgi:hypothetical protein